MRRINIKYQRSINKARNANAQQALETQWSRGVVYQMLREMKMCFLGCVKANDYKAFKAIIRSKRVNFIVYCFIQLLSDGRMNEKHLWWFLEGITDENAELRYGVLSELKEFVSVMTCKILLQKVTDTQGEGDDFFTYEMIWKLQQLCIKIYHPRKKFCCWAIVQIANSRQYEGSFGKSVMSLCADAYKVLQSFESVG